MEPTKASPAPWPFVPLSAEEVHSSPRPGGTATEMHKMDVAALEAPVPGKPVDPRPQAT